MSKGEMLYVKGMNVSDHEYADDVSEEDIWDDSKLNQAYDKAVSNLSVEVAKRIAMATNKSISTEDKSKASKTPEALQKETKNKHKASKSKKQTPNLKWKVGMPCRAVYDADGQEYEAFLLSIVNTEDCVVRFLGYENSEVVSIDSLKPSRGNKERELQIEGALCNQSPNTEDEEDLVGERNMECDSGAGSVSGERPQRRRKKSAKKNRNPDFEMPTGMPFSMPEMPNFNSMHFPSLDVPMTMPPPLPLSASMPSGNAEEQAMCSMLLSWYCSGYYTGLYQGMQRAKQQKQQSGCKTTRH